MSLHGPRVCGYSSFLPKSKDIVKKLIGDSKLPIGMNVWAL
uniref:Uncharacterized protein n=1 Tax=Anguilla anguilla TaxID=7936 RepID=A0A0E9QP41_ANGAN